MSKLVPLCNEKFLIFLSPRLLHSAAAPISAKNRFIYTQMANYLLNSAHTYTCPYDFMILECFVSMHFTFITRNLRSLAKICAKLMNIKSF